MAYRDDLSGDTHIDSVGSYAKVVAHKGPGIDGVFLYFVLLYYFSWNYGKDSYSVS